MHRWEHLLGGTKMQTRMNLPERAARIWGRWMLVSLWAMALSWSGAGLAQDDVNRPVELGRVRPRVLSSRRVGRTGRSRSLHRL